MVTCSPSLMGSVGQAGVCEGVMPQEPEPRRIIRPPCEKCGRYHYKTSECVPGGKRIHELEEGLAQATDLLGAAIERIEELEIEVWEGEQEHKEE